jgi:hypothetical protein
MNQHQQQQQQQQQPSSNDKEYMKYMDNIDGPPESSQYHTHR